MFDLGMVAELRTAMSAPIAEMSDPERIDLIHGLEELKCTAEAAQAMITRDFDASQRAEQAARGVAQERQGVGVAAQVALARRESPHKGQQHLGLARILPQEMPQTMAAWREGRITEWRAQLLARETACLSLAHRRIVDAELAADPDRLEAMGDGEVVAAARKIAYRLDAASFVERRRRAERDRRVTLRPAPDVMAHLSTLLPVKDGVSVFASLKKYADGRIADGDERGHGQIMADTLVARVTGTGGFDAGSADIPTAEEPEASARPSTTVNLTVPDRVLLGFEEGAGWVEGYGPVPGDLAREMAAEADRLRRLYLTPETGDLVTMDSKADLFPPGLATFLRLRDRTCRSRWCDAPIRHADHVKSRAEGGPTSAPNGQGLCQACNSWVEEPRDEASRNHAKAAPGWSARPRPGPRHTVLTRTPTGHTYDSTAPPADRDPRPGRRMGWQVNRLTLAN